MAGRCTVCDHDQRAAIETALAVASVRDIAGRFGLSKSAVHAHKQKHLEPAIRRVIASREELGASALVEKLLAYVEDAESGIELAKANGDLTGLARCIKEAHGVVLSLGKTIGVWSDRPQVVNDNRRQLLVQVGELTTDELRSLARLSSSGGAVPSENRGEITTIEQLN